MSDTQQPAAHAAPPPRTIPGTGAQRRHVLVAIVNNRPGVLNRVASLMRARNFNIESLAVSHLDDPEISRMTITLLGGLLHVHVVAAQGDGHARDLRVVEVADREGLDVEVAGPHQARHAVQDAGAIVDDRDEHVAPLGAGARDRPRGRRGMRGGLLGFAHSSAPPHFSIRSERPLPAGMIGKTFCSSAISNQTSEGPSTAFAASIAGRTSSGDRTFQAGMP